MAPSSRLLAWVRRLRQLGRRSAVERDMHEEFRFHIDSYAADLVRKGMPPEEARRRAHLEFGGVEAYKIDGRAALGLRLIDEWRGDLRYTWRQLRRAPGFASIAILSIALGIGANTAIFSLMEAAIWKAIPVRDPQQLRLFTYVSGPKEVIRNSWGTWNGYEANGHVVRSSSFSYAAFQAFERAPEPFERVFGFKPIGRITATIDDRAEPVVAHLVSGGFYEGVGVVPIAGRPLVPADDQRGRTETVAVIGDGFWARRFGRDPAVIGRTIRVNQVPVTIVGVNPPGFNGLQSDQAADLIMPITIQPAVLPRRARGPLLDDPDFWWINVVGRLKPGVTDAQAETALQITLRNTIRATLPPERLQLDQPYMRLIAGSRGLDNLSIDFARPLFVLASLVAFVLLIACTNVANLLLARASARRRELGLRMALGAGRTRLTRQLLTEGLVLGAAGGALGLLFGYLARDVIPRLVVPSWAVEHIRADLDLRVLALVMLVTVATSLLFSLAPILQTWRLDVNSSLKDGGRTMANVAHPMRGRSLVIVQVCLSVLLLIGAGLFLRTLVNLRAIPLGFQPEQVALFKLDPPRSQYGKESRIALFEEIDRRIAAIPGVVVSSLSDQPVISGQSSTTTVATKGGKTEVHGRTHINTVSHRFFETMRIPMLMGRTFDARDHKQSPTVAIVNQAFVRRFFPDGNALGGKFKTGPVTYQIVGVCADVHFQTTRSAIPPTFYPLFAQAEDAGGPTFEVRSAAAMSSLVPLIREAVRGVDKDLAVFDIRTQTQQIDATLRAERLFVTLTTAFGVLALMLSAVGIYGIMAQNVARRTSEIGVRLALGAARGNVLWMVLREAWLLAAIGVVLGTAAGMGLSRYVEVMLFNLSRYDPIAIGGAIVTMMVVALLAGWLPARRACRLDPMVALRHE